MKWYIGTSGWTYNHWRGSFYPHELPTSKWFSRYMSVFPTVEVNATFYRRFKDTTYSSWKNKTPEWFRFALKIPRTITHWKFLIDTGKDISDFCKQALLLGDKLGCVLLQLPPQMHYNPELLNRALNYFDKKVKVVVEFRNSCWYTDEIKNILINTGTVFCNADSPQFKLNDWITDRVAYIRLHGRENWYVYDYSETELDEIAEVLIQYKNRGVEETYIFFNNDYQGNAPKNAQTLTRVIKEKS